jgi:ATP-dependent RNA helicase SrmB
MTDVRLAGYRPHLDLTAAADAHEGFDPATFDDLSEPLLRGSPRPASSTPTPVQAAGAARGAGGARPAGLRRHRLRQDRRLPAADHAATCSMSPRRVHGSPRVLILVPTRELARADPPTSWPSAATRGSPPRSSPAARTAAIRSRAAAQPGHPGRDAGPAAGAPGDRRGGPRRPANILVLDEADRMLDMGFAEDVFAILGHCRRERQSHAVLRHAAPARPRRLAEHLLREPRPSIITARAASGHHHPDPAQRRPGAQARCSLRVLADRDGLRAGLVFVNTRARAAEQLGAELAEAGFRAAPCCTASSTSASASASWACSATAASTVLVATDVAARGLDVPGVQR